MPEALPTSPLKLTDAIPRAGDWIDLATAERRSGWNLKKLQRLCGAEWLAQGLAAIRPPRGGGKPCWHVHEHAHARLSPGAFPHLEAFDESQLKPAQRRDLHRRKRILDGWLDARRAGKGQGIQEREVTAAYIASLLDSKSLTRGTLFDWQRRYQEAGGLAGLVDRRWLRYAGPDAATSAEPMLEEVKRLYLLPAKLKITHCYLLALTKAVREGWPLCSKHQARRAVATIPRAVVLWNREGTKAFTDEAEPYIERDYTTLSSNEKWCADHHRFDVLIVLADGRHVRPWVTAWSDLRSRKLLGWSVFAHDPNQDTVLRTFRDAVKAHGVPGSVLIDNGRDFQSRALTGETKRQRRARRAAGAYAIDIEQLGGVFGSLGVARTNCQPYHGQSKPIERWFGTMEDAFGRCWPTYCGCSPADKPEVLSRRLAGGQAPTLEELAEGFDRYVAAYNAAPHTGQGMDGKSPDQVYAACLRVKKTADPLELDLHTQKRIGPVKVRQNGVTYQGLRYGQYDPELIRRLGQSVYLRVDAANLSRVTAWTEDDKFVCVAGCNARLPANATEQELREAQANKRRASRVGREYFEARPRMADDLVDHMHHARVAANRRAGTDKLPATPPPTEERIERFGDDALRQLRRSLDRGDRRKAAGAESVDLLKAIEGMDSRPIGRFHYERREEEEPLPDTFSILSSWARTQRHSNSAEEA